MGLRARLVTLRAEHLLRRADRQRRRQLRAELGSYTSQADLDDLYATLASYPDGDTHEIREVLGRRRSRRRVWRAGGAGA